MPIKCELLNRKKTEDQSEILTKRENALHPRLRQKARAQVKYIELKLSRFSGY